MFIGSNTLRLNEATVKEALQEYLSRRTAMGVTKPSVQSVSELQSCGAGRVFEVHVKTDEAVEPA